MSILTRTTLGDPVIIGLVVIFVVLVFLIRRYIQDRGNLPLPPKPPGWPIIGNTVEFITAAKDGAMHLLLAKWAQKYGRSFAFKWGQSQTTISTPIMLSRFVLEVRFRMSCPYNYNRTLL
jgi:hypothetical protein